MKKVFLSLIISTFMIGVQAQDIDLESYTKLESNKELQLSPQQIARIKKLNREVGPKFQAIGRSNLSGYEKGRQKRALALEHKQAIRQILSENQIDIWERRHGSMKSQGGLRNIVKDDYEIRLERLEKRYEADKDRIEDSLLPKDEKKARLKALKKKYKNQKEDLKDKRDRSIRSGVFSK